MTPFSAIITPKSVSFTGPSGKLYSVETDHPNWKDILEKIKELKADTQRGGHFTPKIHQQLVDLVDVSSVINDAGAGKVVVRGGVVYYDGEPVNLLVTERILWGLKEGFDMTPYMLFLDHSMNNPSSRAVNEMYRFMEQCRMGITEDGHILGYKRVRGDFTDIYTGKFDNSPGKIVEMKRNKVNDNPNETCSHGLHFCSISYLPHYGAGPGNKVVIVKVNPADIVSVPIDYNNAKVRCCRYEVLAEYTNPDLSDILQTRAVWSDNDFSDHSDDDDDGEWSIDDDDDYADHFWDGLDEMPDHSDDDDDDDEDDATEEVVAEVEAVSADDEYESREINALIEEDLATNQQLAEEQVREHVIASAGIFGDAVRNVSNLTAEVPVAPIPAALQINDPEGGLTARFDALFSARLAAEQKRREQEANEILARLTEDAREQAIKDFHAELMQHAIEAMQVWHADSKKAPNLPTSDQVQEMLGSLAADLRRAEIAAGVSSTDFDWEKWLDERAAERILAEVGGIDRNTAVEIAQAVVARRIEEPEMIAVATPEGLVSASTQASVRAALEELKRKLGKGDETKGSPDE